MNDLEQRLVKAHSEFKRKASDSEQDALKKLLEDAHRKAWEIIEGNKSSAPHHTEIAHAMSVLFPEDAKDLPRSKTDYDTLVRPDGSLFGSGKWELLDFGWLEALTCWLEHIDDQATFNTNPVTVPIANDASFCIVGDWGTGFWRKSPLSPAEKIAHVIQKEKVDYTVHLGDVYYAGTMDQEKNNLIDIWPKGSKGAFTLNSNHEMYCGAKSYFYALEQEFPLQAKCSYFALENDNWLIIGLDSAYYSDKWQLYMDGELGEAQQKWLKSLPAKNGIIILSHHTGYELKGENKTQLYEQVMSNLSNSDNKLRYQNVYWYWGHEHNAVVYADQLDNNVPIRSRCIGHGSLPYGNASELKGKPQITWYETQSANDPDTPLRVLNGFAKVELAGNQLTESLFGENGTCRWQNVD